MRLATNRLERTKLCHRFLQGLHCNLVNTPEHRSDHAAEENSPLTIELQALLVKAVTQLALLQSRHPGSVSCDYIPARRRYAILVNSILVLIFLQRTRKYDKAVISKVSISMYTECFTPMEIRRIETTW